MLTSSMFWYGMLAGTITVSLLKLYHWDIMKIFLVLGVILVLIGYIGLGLGLCQTQV